MKRRLAATAAAVLSAASLAIVGGCAGKAKPVAKTAQYEVSSSVAYGSFEKRDVADLQTRSPFKSLNYVGDTLYALTESNRVYAMSPTLDLRYSREVTSPGELVRTPLMVGDATVFPTATELKFFDASGENTKTIDLPHPMTSDVQLDPRGLLLTGTAAPTGGRVAMVDPEADTRAVRQDTLIGTVTAAPAAFQGVVYAATEAGKVFAIGPENRSLWPFDGMAFQTNRAVKANLVVDDYAVYVASTDTTLYALDRTTGRIRWRYMAQMPLDLPPVVTNDRVYQVVPDVGLVALDKAEGGPYRQPLWTAENVNRVLSIDDTYVYAVAGKGKVVAIDVETGKARLNIDGNFDLFAAGADGTVYAATRGGNLLSFVRAPYRGDANAAAR